MNEEEKKAIERIDYIQDFIIENGQYNADVNDMQYFSKVLNIIKKQSKEIEELKEEYNTKLLSNAGIYQLGFNDGEKSVKDKIKAKIEPVLKQLDTKMEEEYNKYGNSREYQDIVDAYNFLQSLLEKE